MKDTVNTSSYIIKTPTHYKPHTYTHQHFTKQVTTTTVQDTHQIKLTFLNRNEIPYFLAHMTHRPIRHTVIFSLGEQKRRGKKCILILVIYWKKT